MLVVEHCRFAVGRRPEVCYDARVFTMARQNPVADLGRTVRAHADAAIGTPARAAAGAAEGIGGRVLDAADAVRRWWREGGRGPRRTTDIRLPNEGRGRRSGGGRRSSR